MQNFSHRLIAEFERGGKKSAVLAVLFLVGLYFWIPMFMPVGTREASPVVAGAVAAGSPQGATSRSDGLAAPTMAAPDASLDWKAIHERLANSPVVQPTLLDELVRDPFDRAWSESREQVQGEAPTESAPPDENPLQGIVCSSTIIGPDVRMAMINDGIYRVGDKVPPKGAVQFVVKDISPDKVVLERDGQEVPLRVTRGRDE